MKILWITILLILLSSITLAQSEYSLRAEKLDAFGKLNDEEWKKKLDSFGNLQNQFENTSLNIVYYAEVGETDVTIFKTLELYSDYLDQNKEFSDIYFKFIPGGFRHIQTTEIWRVPLIADYPKLTPDVALTPKKYDEFGIVDEKIIKTKLINYKIDLRINYLRRGYLNHGFIVNHGTAEQIAEREYVIRQIIKFRHFDGPLFSMSSVEDTNLKTVLLMVNAGTSISESLSYFSPKQQPTALKFDDFGKVSNKYYNQTLLKFLKYIIKADNSLAIIVNSTGTYERETKKFQLMEDKLIQNQYVTVNNLQNRIKFIKAGKRKFQRTQLWIVPLGAKMPTEADFEKTGTLNN